MTKADLGKKRACLACGMRFYDFNRSPIECPGCGAVFDPENIIKSRKGRPAAKTTVRDDVSATDDNQINEDANALTDAIVDDKDDDDINFDGDDEVDVDDGGPGIIQDDIGDGDELMPNLDDKEEN